MAQQGQQVSTTLDKWANRSKTESTSTPTYTANRRIEDVTGLEKARSRGTNTEASTTQANDRRDPRYNDNNNGGYNDNRRQPEYNDRNARNRNYDPRDDDRRRYDDRDQHESCSKDKYRGRDNHGYGRGSANRSNNRDRDDDRYRDRDDDREEAVALWQRIDPLQDRVDHRAVVDAPAVFPDIVSGDSAGIFLDFKSAGTQQLQLVVEAEIAAVKETDVYVVLAQDLGERAAVDARVDLHDVARVRRRKI